MTKVSRDILLALGIILFQGFTLKNLDIGTANWWITPYIIFYLWLVLPMKWTPLANMSIAFLIGLITDLFYDTYGLLASASVFSAFVKSQTVNFVIPKDTVDINQAPNIFNIGFSKYILLAGITSLSFHLWFFIIERFSFVMFFLRLSQALVSALLALLIIILLQYITVKKKKI